MNQPIRLAICLIVGICLACKEKPAPQASSSSATAGAESAPNPVEAVAPDLGGALKGHLGSMPIWVDIRLPDSAGEVSGTYLYLKHRKDIPVSGKRTGKVLDLTEGEAGKVIGVFHLEFLPADTEGDDGWEGTWTRPGKKKSLPVRLVPARADFKACHLADPESLRVEDGGTLAQKMADHTPSQEEGDPPPPTLDGPTEPTYEVTGCAGGLMSVSYTWYYPVRGVFVGNTKLQWTFDLAKKQEITLWGEIDSAKAGEFTRFLSKGLTPILQQMSEAKTEEEGKEESSFPESPAPLEIGDNMVSLEMRIEEGKILVGWLNYFELSAYDSALRGLDSREVWMELDPKELRSFLKQESVLRTLVSKP